MTEVRCPYADCPENMMGVGGRPRRCSLDVLSMEGNAELVFCASKERLDEADD